MPTNSPLSVPGATVAFPEKEGPAMTTPNIVGPADLTLPELVAFNALLRPAYDRVRAGHSAAARRDELLYRAKKAMTAVPPGDLTADQLRVIAAIVVPATDRAPLIWSAT
jgi:hypothetical protein